MIENYDRNKENIRYRVDSLQMLNRTVIYCKAAVTVTLFMYCVNTVYIYYLCLFIRQRTRGRVDSILSRIRAGGSVVRILVKARYVPRFKNVHTASGAHAASCSLGISVLYRG